MPGTAWLETVTTVRPALDAALRHTIALRTETLFRSRPCGGHFLLKSRRHGDAYLEKFLVLQDPAATSELCGFFAGRRGRGRTGTPSSTVAGPTTGGVILAFETARQLGIRAIFAEEVGGDAGRHPSRVPALASRIGVGSASCSSTTSSRPAARCLR